MLSQNLTELNDCVPDTASSANKLATEADVPKRTLLASYDGALTVNQQINLSDSIANYDRIEVSALGNEQFTQIHTYDVTTLLNATSTLKVIPYSTLIANDNSGPTGCGILLQVMSNQLLSVYGIYKSGSWSTVSMNKLKIWGVKA